MKLLLIIILVLSSLYARGQNKKCFCEKDSLMNRATISCDTTFLSNGSILFWQFNCDRIWFTFENVSKQKTVLDDVPVSQYIYTYRLGYHLIKEYKKSILFRSKCPADGACIYTLVDKNDGEKIKEFNQLICIDTDLLWRNAHEYPYDFVAYLSNSRDSIIIYYVDKKKKIKIPFKEKLAGEFPENQFESMKLNKNNLTIVYVNDDNRKEIKIKLKEENNDSLNLTSRNQ